ncbi:hypothetical protein F5Y03DRAFT_380579 [Xylaria venustula]|nr:hypothetical protein F5Y03DRAFT_380579 [Xylaria venustula]
MRIFRPNAVIIVYHKMEISPIKEIRFRTRTVKARAHQIANRQVYRVEIPSSPIQKWLIFLFPVAIRTALQRLIPEWLLPPVILLKEMDPTRPDDFHNEVSTYKRLRGLQGYYVPRCFGTAISDNAIPALVLDYVDGTPLHQLDLETLVSPVVLQAYHQHTTLPTVQSDDIPNPHLALALKNMFDALSKYGVVHGDGKLHNFIWTNDRVIAIDFEFAYLLPHDTTNIPFYYGLVHEIGDMIDYWSLEDPVVQETRRRAEAEEFKRWWADLRAKDRGIKPLDHTESRPLHQPRSRRPEEIFFKVPGAC